MKKKYLGTFSEPQKSMLCGEKNIIHTDLPRVKNIHACTKLSDTSAGTGKLCILGHLGLVFIWSCFVSCLLFLLFYVAYVICAPVPAARSGFQLR